MWETRLFSQGVSKYDHLGTYGKTNKGKKKKEEKKEQPTHLVEDISYKEDVYVETMYHIVSDNKLRPYEVSLDLCNEPYRFEIDTGAARSILSQETYSKSRDKVELRCSRAVLSTYNGERISVTEEVTVPVNYQDQQHYLPAIAVKGPGPNLLGRDWLQVVKLNWQDIFNIQENNPQLQRVLEEHNKVFSNELGTLTGTKAKIYVDPEATPNFMKARPVPYALKAKVEMELDRLRSEGLLSPVEFSECAAPIVPVVKQDGTVRICGDYKCTVNQVSKLDNYTIPNTEDLLAKLGGGNRFTKLDMPQAYQQLELEEGSKTFTTINTHKGLYQ